MQVKVNKQWLYGIMYNPHLFIQQIELKFKQQPCLKEQEASLLPIKKYLKITKSKILCKLEILSFSFNFQKWSLSL